MEQEDTNVIELYLQEIEYAPLLTPEQEVKYGRLARDGDQDARKRMIVSNLRLVVKMARRYLNRGLPLADLIEEGNLGLMHAVDKFDPERGFRFSTYATWWIRHDIERAIMSQARTIRLPIHVEKEIHKCYRVVREIVQKEGKEPSMQEIASKMDKPVDKVHKLLKYAEPIDSLDVPVSDTFGGMPVSYISGHMPSAEDVYHDNTRDALVQTFLRAVKYDCREVLERRYGLQGDEPLSHKETAAALDLTTNQSYKKQAAGLQTLRKLLEGQHLSLESLL